MALDELLLGEQRLGLGLGDEEVDRGDLVGQSAERRAAREVAGDALADRARLADVDDPPLAVGEHVDAGRVGQVLALLGDAPSRRRCRPASGHTAPTVGRRVIDSRPAAPNGRGPDERSRSPDPSSRELKTMRLEVDGDVGTLTLDRPDELNAMSPEMIGELAMIAPWLADRAPIPRARRHRRRPRLLRRRRRHLVPARARRPRRRPRRLGPARRRRPPPGDRRLQADPLSGDRRRQRARRGRRLLAGADVRHPDRLRRRRSSPAPTAASAPRPTAA